MRLSVLLALPAGLLPQLFAVAVAASTQQQTPEKPDSTYTEHLTLNPLPQNNLYAGFSFTSTTPLGRYSNNHYRYFPRSLAQILQYTHARELHLRFSAGRWNDEGWGARPRSGLREGAGSGVELWAWIEGDEARSASGRWRALVNSLSGLFCASLNFIDESKTIRPLLSFEPEGTLQQLQIAQRNTTGEQHGELELLHGILPHEVVCTENLTPFLKLLPCKGKAGISSLLDGHKVFDANWQTMSVDVRPVCQSTGECDLEIQQTVDIVLDMQRSQRPRDDPIPRPPPIEDIGCDETKSYHADDTCYPRTPPGEPDWSLSNIFGRPIRGSCPLGRPGRFDIKVTVPASRSVNIFTNDTTASQQTGKFQSANGEAIRLYRIPEGQDFDLHLPAEELPNDENTDSQPQSLPAILAHRQLTGHGTSVGTLHTTLTNPHSHAQQIIYLETLPWFLRPYIHSLTLSEPGKIKRMYYTPHLDRHRPTHLEMLLEIPARSTVELHYYVEKAILRYTEYPPDANRGFDVPAAVIRVLPPRSNLTLEGGRQTFGEQGSYLRTTSLLLPLPTPDFSMPYNVIILTSTVIALGFGSIFNLLVRQFVLVEEVPEGFLRKGIKKVREVVAKLGKGNDEGVVVVKGGKEKRVVNGELKGKEKAEEGVRERVKANGKVGSKKDR